MTWWQVGYIGSLPPRKEQLFILTGIDPYSGYGFAFPDQLKPPSVDIAHLIYRHDIPCSIPSDQRTHFTAKEVRQWAHDHGIHWSYHGPYYPEAASLTERWNGLLKTHNFIQILR